MMDVDVFLCVCQNLRYMMEVMHINYLVKMGNSFLMTFDLLTPLFVLFNSVLKTHISGITGAMRL